MLEFKNVLDVTYAAYVANSAYPGVNSSNDNSMQIADRDQSAAIIREFPAGRTAAVRQNADDVGTAVSVLQIFTDAIETIAEKLLKMLELAKKKLDGDYSLNRAKQMQKQFQDLARQINQIVKRTEYKFNKPFSGGGKTLSIPAGNGVKIDIFARDFRIDTQGLNIETDTQNALSKVNGAITNVNEYKTYLDRQAAYLKDITTIIESEIQSALGVDMRDFQPELAAPMADYTASMILQDKQTSLNTKANLTSSKILNLLKNTD